MTRQLDLVNTLVAEGRPEFSFQDALGVTGASPTATANTLNRLTQRGLIDRVARGHYAVRPLGSLGTSAISENLALAVGAAFEGRLHRIAYRSALSDLGLLTHPVRTVFVACQRQVGFSTASGRPLRVVIERQRTIHVETERVGRSWRSTLDRALFECAMRIDLAGGVERLAEALASGARDADANRIAALAQLFGARGSSAERRLASLAHVLDLPLKLDRRMNKKQSVIRLDPRDERNVWTDSEFNVMWNISAEEMQAVIAN